MIRRSHSRLDPGLQHSRACFGDVADPGTDLESS